MAHHHMRRSAVSVGRPGGLIRGIAWKGNMRAADTFKDRAVAEVMKKILGVFL